jgi:hypothetical protein
MPKPVSPNVHRIIDFVAVLLLLAAGPLFGFKGQPGEITSTLAGVVLVYSVFTWFVKLITLKVHLVIDAVLGLAMIFSPFWLGFSDLKPACIFFVGFGLFTLLIVLLTDSSVSRPA